MKIKYNIKAYNYEFFQYKNKHYVKMSVNDIEAGTQKMFDEWELYLKVKDGITVKNQCDIKFRNEVTKYIQVTSTINESDINPWLIATENAILDIKNKTVETLNPGVFVPYYINAKHSKDAKCGKIDKFIEDVVGIKHKNTIYEIIADCLFPGYSLKKITLLYGKGDSGKTTLANLIRHFLGSWNVSAISCFDFKYQFGMTSILNTLAIISSELPTGYLTPTIIGHMKRLSGGDPFDIYVKHVKYPVNYLNRGKILYTSNSTPSLSKEQIRDEEAFIRRWNIINCPNKFPRDGGEFFATLITEDELAGLLNNVLEAVKRLSENKKFSTETTYKENLEYFKKFQQKEKKGKATFTVEYGNGEEIDEDKIGDEINE
jgi:putative DNA primase/helicase